MKNFSIGGIKTEQVKITTNWQSMKESLLAQARLNRAWLNADSFEVIDGANEGTYAIKTRTDHGHHRGGEEVTYHQELPQEDIELAKAIKLFDKMFL